MWLLQYEFNKKMISKLIRVELQKLITEKGHIQDLKTKETLAVGKVIGSCLDHSVLVLMSQLEEGETERCLKNGESAPSSNVDVQSEAANVSASKSFFKQNLVEQGLFRACGAVCFLFTMMGGLMKQKNAKRKSDMTLEEMYNGQHGFEDDEDDDSDWEPSALPDHHVVEVPKWFCLNCTMVNIGDDLHCDVCGEHRESGILKRGHLASPFYGAEGLTEDDAHAADGLQGPSLQSFPSDNATAIGFDERMLLHEEVVMKSHPHPERPDRIRAIAASLAAAGRCYPISAREITREELLMVHSVENIEAVELTSHVLSSYFTPDTYANQYSASAARLAAGLCFDLAAAICSGSAKNGFALDVHHGNGTQEIFEKNKSIGVMGAEGYCVNVPWSCGGVGDNDYVFAFQQ
ncbi:UNVERIFIED_CONTAM: Histone deacetylase 15, partial [Sesamum indicum]